MLTLPDRPLRAEVSRLDLKFTFTAITSRASMIDKETWLLTLTDTSTGEVGVGECAIFRGLSAEDTPGYEANLRSVCAEINAGRRQWQQPLPSSIAFGLETAALTLANGDRWRVFDTPWSRGKGSLTINGLVWMGSREQMLERIGQKLDAGFKCLKLKIGGIDFDSEVGLLKAIRERHSADALEIRLDANGAFTPQNALQRLDLLARFDIHSIEQPIRAGQWSEMATICATSPIPIALDEELIGLSDTNRRARLLESIRPAYIILKPSLCGGLQASRDWIADAEERGIGWWITSALESNVGLNAVAQLASTYAPTMPQGLGTGQLYHNNIPSPLRLSGENLWFDTLFCTPQ